MGDDSKPEETNYPSPFQRRMVWTGLTAFFIVLIGAIAVGAIWLTVRVIAYLQPLLVPLAAAAVIAYLLYPLVHKLRERGISDKKAGSYVFFGFLLSAIVLFAAIAIPLTFQARNLVEQYDSISTSFKNVVDENLSVRRLYELKEEHQDTPLIGDLLKLIPFEDQGEDVEPETETDSRAPEPSPADSSPETTAPSAPDETSVPPNSPPAQENVSVPSGPSDPATLENEGIPELDLDRIDDWIVEQLPVISNKIWSFVRQSVGGFLGAFGFVLGFFLVPLYLFFFLREGTTISETWSRYIPLKQSEFKDEVVGTLREVNDYLIAFFRGQMLVSLIDGMITALLLTVLGVKFGLLIGLLVGILGVIPFVGIIICYVPAVIIATVQGANGAWYIAPDAPWWMLPVVVTAVFLAVNNLDGVFIAPKIVGDSVGLHPLTVIFSVLFWSLVLGGLLGALLAVPLTASIKVLFRRYIWERRIGRLRDLEDGEDKPDAPSGDRPAPEPA